MQSFDKTDTSIKSDRLDYIFHLNSDSYSDFDYSFFCSSEYSRVESDISSITLGDVQDEDSTEEDEETEEFILRDDEINNDDEDELSPKRRKRVIGSCIDFWETTWGRMINHPNVMNPRTAEGKKFRRRFRMPFPVFQYLVKQCSDHNIFGTIYQTKIPIEAKVLGCLRILARDQCADDVNLGSDG